MSEIVKSPGALKSYLKTCSESNVSEVTVKVPTGEYTQKKFNIKVFGFTVSGTMEEEKYMVMTFKFNQN